jgi:hypothetical protein
MDRKTLFKRLAGLIFIIFILNFLAQKFYLYFSIWWFDMPMHFLGGLWLGFFFLWILSYKDTVLKLDVLSVLKTLSGVLVLGIFWELFEFYFINHMAENPFNVLDTVSDIFFDIAGGLLGVFYYFRRFSGRIMSNNLNEVE